MNLGVLTSMVDIIKEFTKNDQKIRIQFRLARREDLEDIWENFNEVVKEGIYIPVKTEVRTDYEKNSWFANHELEKNVIMVGAISLMIKKEARLSVNV